jgi:glyoxylase-like metal-dependent hydrolase (beta-lactamase superfamily II)
MSETIKIHVLQTGKVRVSPYLPFGGEHCSIFKAAGLTTPKNKWIWLPVSCYLIEHPEHGYILVDTGWSREMSPDGIFDRKAQIRSLGSRFLYMANQGMVEEGQTIGEQLLNRGIDSEQLRAVLLTHLDCDHANGINDVSDAQQFLVSRAEVEQANKPGLSNRIRYQKRWWRNVELTAFDWNGTEGPFHRSYDVFGDGSVVMVNIPGHCDGLCAVKVSNAKGKFVLLFSDGGYATRSWQEMILSGVAENREQQKQSLAWIREQSMSPDCVESLACHDTAIQPHVIEL